MCVCIVHVCDVSVLSVMCVGVCICVHVCVFMHPYTHGFVCMYFGEGEVEAE